MTLTIKTNTYHGISTVGVSYITNRSKNGLIQLMRIPSIQLSCAEDRMSVWRLSFRKSRTCSGAISNSKASFYRKSRADDLIDIPLKMALLHFFDILIRA